MRQFFARSPTTYWLPRLAIEPSRTAALAVRSQMSFAISGRQPRVRRLAHQTQHLLDTLLGDEAEKWRLLQLYRQSLAKRPVKHGVAGRVVEIGEDNRVLVREVLACGEESRSSLRPAASRMAASETTSVRRLKLPRAVPGSARVVTRRESVSRFRRGGRRECPLPVGIAGCDPSRGTCRRCAPVPAARRDSGVPQGRDSC